MGVPNLLFTLHGADTEGADEEMYTAVRELQESANDTTKCVLWLHHIHSVSAGGDWACCQWNLHSVR